MTKPTANRISVVIPTLNEEKYIDTTLYHLMKQNPYEVIVADSFSTDKTAKIARRYGCKIVNAKKGTPATGRNHGARAARGDIIVFLDADSIVFSNLLEIIAKDFRRNSKLMGWTCPIYGFSNSWKEQVIYNMSNNLVEFFIKTGKAHAPGIIIAVRKKAFEEVGGFNEKLKVMEDHDFAMRVNKIGGFKFSRDTCVYTSTRRMKKWGGLGLIKKYSKIYLSYFLRKKHFNDNIEKIEYEAIR